MNSAILESIPWGDGILRVVLGGCQRYVAMNKGNPQGFHNIQFWEQKTTEHLKTNSGSLVFLKDSNATSGFFCFF